MTSFIIAVAFVINEIIDLRIKDKSPSERIKIRLLIHFIISFSVIFILYLDLAAIFFQYARIKNSANKFNLKKK